MSTIIPPIVPALKGCGEPAADYYDKRVEQVALDADLGRRYADIGERGLRGADPRNAV